MAILISAIEKVKYAVVPNARFVSVIKRKLAVILRILTPRTDLLMNPYFVPVLAQLLMEGVARRALSQTSHGSPQSLTPVFLPVSIADESARRRVRAEDQARTGFRGGRNFGSPGSFQ